MIRVIRNFKALVEIKEAGNTMSRAKLVIPYKIKKREITPS
jgi:hypothetical protein